MPRKHLPEEPESHDRWLMSYADFITLLFAFFVVMYAISQVNESKHRVLSDSLVQAFQNPSRLPDAESPTNSPRSILGQEHGGIIGPAPGSPEKSRAAIRTVAATRNVMTAANGFFMSNTERNWSVRKSVATPATTVPFCRLHLTEISRSCQLVSRAEPTKC
jgi:flagellar motor protein MotB